MKHYCMHKPHNAIIKSLLAMGALLLGGCSYMHSEQYRFPEPHEPSATVRMADHADDAKLIIANIGETGCYAGLTPVPSNTGEFKARVRTGKELVMTYIKKMGPGVCQLPFAFTPQAGATYTLVPGFRQETIPGVIPMTEHEQSYCSVAIFKKDADGENRETIKKLNIRPGMPCIRVVESQ